VASEIQVAQIDITVCGYLGDAAEMRKSIMLENTKDLGWVTIKKTVPSPKQIVVCSPDHLHITIKARLRCYFMGPIIYKCE